MKRKLLLMVAGALFGMGLMEVSLRIFARRLDLDNSVPAVTPYRYEPAIGYELRPNAVVTGRDEFGWRFDETMDGEGFRGPELSPAKPAGTYRILALGDSVVQAITVRQPYSWEAELERLMNSRMLPGRRVEIQNCGIGGYVSWQAEARLRRHGLRYHPDLVVVLVGWNDMLYSALPIWKPGLDLSQIDQAYASFEAEHPKQDVWSRFKRALSWHVYVIRLISHQRDAWRSRPRFRAVIATHQQDFNLPFNARALSLYAQNLELIYRSTRGSGARMALMTWPTLLSPDLVADPQIHPRLLQTYVHFKLSTRELWSWHERYQQAQRNFARRHPDILFIDLAKDWASSDKAERLRDFVDMAHLSIEGNRRLAETLEKDLR